MYGLPTSFDAKCFEGATLERLCFSSFQVDFLFDNKAQISIGMAFTINDRLYEIPLTQTPPLSILGKQVLIGAKLAGDISLTLSNNDIITFIEVDGNFESYTIDIGGSEIIV